MKEIEPSIDVYGSAAPRSALADFVELAAVGGQRVGEEFLANYIDDANLNTLSDERYFEPAAGTVERSSDPEEVARSVFSLLEERRGLLQQRYPFEPKRGRWQLVKGGQRTPYLALLAITVAHAYELVVVPDPTEVFPVSATLGLHSIGLSAECLTQARRGRTFAGAVAHVGDLLRLHPTPESGLRSVNANDAGVDVVVATAWGDRRAGAWSCIGQATCGSSDTWRRKVGEPSPTSWRHYLNTTLRPLPFLAVPHHIEPRHFDWLTQEADALLLDRLRLVAFRDDVTSNEQLVIDAVLDNPVASLY